MKGNTKQDDSLIQNLHDAGCSQQIIEQFMQSRKEGNIFCQMIRFARSAFWQNSGTCFLKPSIRIRTSWIALITFFFN